MTIRLLTPWNNFPAGFVGEVRSPEIEDWLVSIGHATRDLGEAELPDAKQLAAIAESIKWVDIAEISDLGGKTPATFL